MVDQCALLAARVERARNSLDTLVATVANMSDEEVTAPSLLPGWTRGHVITHIARNADGMANLAAWAVTGEPRPMYPSRESRDADIDAGASRSTADLADDLTLSGRRFADAWQHVVAADEPALRAALARRMHLGAPSPHAPGITGALAPVARRREIEVHRVDLGLDENTATDWPTDFPAELLDAVAPTRISADGLAGVARLVDDEGVRWPLSAQSTGLTLQGPTWALALWLIGRRVNGSVLLAIDEQGSARAVPSPQAWV